MNDDASDLRDSLPPSSVRFSVDEQSGDDHSDLTGPYSDENDSREDDFGIDPADPDDKHAEDPYRYHAVDGAANPPTTTGQEQELFRLKLQVERQQEKIHELSSRLSHCEAENEALKTEKAILVDELARAATASQEPLIPNAVRQGWLSKGAGNNKGGSDEGDDEGTMQMLIDTNTQLMNDNARLQALADVARKSLQLSIKDSRRGDEKHQQTIRRLQKENQRLRETLTTARHLAHAAAAGHSKLSRKESSSSQTSLTRSLTPSGEHTGKISHPDSPSDRRPEDLPVSVSLHSAPEVALRNSLGSIPEQDLPPGGRPGDLPLGASLHSAPEVPLRNSLGSIPEQELPAVDKCNNPVDVSEREEVPNLRLVSQLPIELVQRASFSRRAANAALPHGDRVIRDVADYPRRRSPPDELLVDFGEAARTRHRPRRRQSETADLGPRLVDFEEATHNRRRPRRRPSETADCRLTQSYARGVVSRPVTFSEDAARESDTEADGGGQSRGRGCADLLAEFGGMLAQKRRGAERRLSLSLPQGLAQGLPRGPTDAESERGARRRRGAERRLSLSLPQSLAQGLSQGLPRGPTDAESERGEELLVDFDTARRVRSSARKVSNVEF